MVGHEKYDEFAVKSHLILNLVRERTRVAIDYDHHICIDNEQKRAKYRIVL